MGVEQVEELLAVAARLVIFIGCDEEMVLQLDIPFTSCSSTIRVRILVCSSFGFAANNLKDASASFSTRTHYFTVRLALVKAIRRRI